MKRPGFLRMLEDIKAGKINAVIVTELSRLTRNVKDFMQLWDFFKKYDCTFFSLKENFDTSTPIGEMMVIQCISFSQLERKTTVERIKAGALARAKRGLANGGPRLLGYDPDPQKANYLIVNKDEKPLVKLIFTKYLELKKISSVCDWLNKNGYRTKKYITKSGKSCGGNFFTHSSIYNLLINKTYIGVREFNKRNKWKDQSTLKENERCFDEKGIWKPIVSTVDFNKVQKLLNKNKRTIGKHKRVYPLSNMIVCGECGEKLKGGTHKGRSNEYSYYEHDRKKKSKDSKHKERCIIERVSAHLIEDKVISRLKHLKKNKELVRLLAERSRDVGYSRVPELEKLILSRKGKLKELEQKTKNLVDRIASLPLDIPAQSLYETLKTMEKEKNQVQGGIEELESEKSALGSNVVDLGYVFRMLDKFSRGFSKKSALEQKELIAQIVDSIVVTRDQICISYFGAAEDEDIGLDIDIFGRKVKKEPKKVPVKGNVEPLRSAVCTDFQMVDQATKLLSPYNNSVLAF